MKRPKYNTAFFYSTITALLFLTTALSNNVWARYGYECNFDYSYTVTYAGTSSHDSHKATAADCVNLPDLFVGSSGGTITNKSTNGCTVKGHYANSKATGCDPNSTVTRSGTTNGTWYQYDVTYSNSSASK